MTIAAKLKSALVMTCIIVVICILIPFMTSRGLDRVRGQLTGYEGLQDEVVLSQELQLQVANLWQFMTDASLTRDRDAIDKEARQAYRKAEQATSRLIERNGKDAGHLAKLRAIQQALPGMWQTGNRMYEAYGTSREEGNRAMEQYDKACDQAIKNAEEVAELSRRDGRKEMKGVEGSLDRLSAQVYGSGGVATAIGILVMVLMLFLRRSIVRSLSLIVEEVHGLTDGDLSRKFEVSSGDEISRMSGMLNRFIETLQRAVREIKTTSAEVSAASGLLHSTAGGIAEGAGDVALQAGTVATASEEMSATSGTIAQNCRTAAEEAQRASQAAQEGACVVEKTVEVMGQIATKVQESAQTVESLGARGDQIGAIIETIQDIADQTNLLALNAAIEAARAGEQGRGFAVVADEVRALAERTTRATREIGTMINAIQEETRCAVAVMEQGVRQVESGTREAARSGEALRQILEHIDTLGQQVGQIAVAAAEQTATTSEISDNIHRINGLISRTSDGAQESATAAAQLRGNAADLQRLVEQFRL